jgi:hypothetical protein
MEKIALTPRSKELIKNYLIGGAAIGGSGALLTSLVNYINTLKQQVPSDSEKEDDDTLYLNVGKTANESSGAVDFTAGGLALTGGLLSTLGSYALVRKLYQNVKRKQLQEQLDQAQQAFIENANQEAQAKNAAVAPGKPMGVAELSWSAPVAFALLSAIAAGALTNKALDKTFPSIKKPKDISPKRIVVRKSPQKDQEVEEEKMAYDNVSASEQADDALEFLVHLCMGSKSASQSELVDIVHAAAEGRGPDLTTHILEYGFESAMDTIKGASDSKITPIQKQCAISYCVKSAALNPIVSLLAAAEYTDMAPKFTKVASLQTEECVTTLIKIAGVIGALNRRDTAGGVTDGLVEDKAGAPELSLEDILALINKMKGQGQGQGMGEHLSEEDDIEQNEDFNTEDSIDSGEEKHTNDRKPFATGAATPDVIDELSEDDDLIDQAMSAPVTPAKAVAAENK